ESRVAASRKERKTIDDGQDDEMILTSFISSVEQEMFISRVLPLPFGCQIIGRARLLPSLKRQVTVCSRLGRSLALPAPQRPGSERKSGADRRASAPQREESH